WRTRSVAPGLAVYSVTLAVALAIFTGSPIVLAMAFVAGLATGILILVRRTPAPFRITVQWVIAALLVIGLVLVYVFRRPLVYWLNAEPDFYTRSRLWNEILDLTEVSPVQGWGWAGSWPEG